MEFKKVDEVLNKKYSGKKVNLRGWVYRKREQKNLIFIILRDSSNIIQCVVKKDSKARKEAKKITIESSCKVHGKLKKDKRAPTGYEVKVSKLEIVGLADTFPIARDKSKEFLRDVRHLWLRSRKLNAIMKIRHTVIGAIHEFFRKEGYYEFHPPIFTPNACEGGATLFKVNYFDEEAYLTQSWQLYAEAAIFGLGKIYDVAPTFRAEKSRTSRHLTEFWMAEMEAAWMELEECTEVAKNEIKFILRKVLEENKKELEVLGQDIKKLKKISKKDFPTITYTEAINILKEEENLKTEWGKDLRTKEEDALMKHFDTPIVVKDFPKEIMAFYKPKRTPKPKKAPGEVAKCFDMLAPEGHGEIVGGSERDTSTEKLERALKEEGEDPERYDWYLDLRKYGSVPHSGYGLGVERLLSWICGLDNIMDAIAFPRTPDRVKP